MSSTYTYLLSCEETGRAVLIDTAINSRDRDLKVLQQLNLELAYMVITQFMATTSRRRAHSMSASAAKSRPWSWPCSSPTRCKGSFSYFPRLLCMWNVASGFEVRVALHHIDRRGLIKTMRPIRRARHSTANSFRIPDTSVSQCGGPDAPHA